MRISRIIRIVPAALSCLAAYAAAGIAYAEQTGQQATQGFVALTPDAASGFAKLSNVSTGQGGSSLTQYLNEAFMAALSLGAILAVLRIGYAGYLYVTSDAWGNKSHAKEVLGDAVLGLLILLGIWTIIHIINPGMLSLDALKYIPQTTAQQG